QVNRYLVVSIEREFFPTLDDACRLSELGMDLVCLEAQTYATKLTHNLLFLWDECRTDRSDAVPAQTRTGEHGDNDEKSRDQFHRSTFLPRKPRSGPYVPRFLFL